ncbi:MAG: hypothetical protein Q8R55_04590 [Candidatus Taylorbacteria bacterium]|nr:hypothetical protein [Candidatus Taylorbacteria bacterium]
MRNPLESQEQQPLPRRVEQRDTVELSEMKDRLTSIIKQVSGKKEVVVDTELSPEDVMGSLYLRQDPAQIWFAQELKDPKTGKQIFRVHIPKRIFETHEDVAKGSAAHEAGHVAITRTDFIPDEIAQELGFHHQYLAVEELPTDQVVRDRYAGGGRWVDKMREDLATQGETMEEARGQIGYLPKSIQLNNLFVFGQHFKNIFGRLPERYDPNVVDLYEKLRAPLETIENTLPSDEATEEEVIEKAKERYRANYKKIWPEVKKLVEQDLEMEKLRQMLQEAMQEQQKEEQRGEEGEQEGQESQGQEDAEGTAGKPKPGKGEKSMEEQIRDAMKSLGENFQKELEQALKDFAEEQKKREQEKKEKEKAQEGKSDKTEDGDESGQEQQEKDGAGETAKPEGAESGQETEEGGTEEEVPMKKPGEEKSGGNPIPMDKLSEKMIEALEKAYDKLPEELKKALEEKARKVLEELEDKFVKELSPGLTKEGGETHEEFQERLEDEEQKLEAKKEKVKAHQQATEELKDIERRQAALATTREVYDKFYAGLREQDEKLYRELEEVFTPNVKRTIKLKSAGSKINLPAVFRWEASRKAGAGQVDSKIFETVHLPEKKDYVFTLLNDLSGSMSESNKSIEDFKAKILLAEVLSRLGIKNEILGFQDTVITFKKFDEELNDDIRKKMSGMLLEVEGLNPGGHNRAGHNNDGPCLLEASKGLEAQPGKEKFLIVISDGYPTGPHNYQTGKGPDEILTESVNTVLKNTNHKLIALGLGEDTEHVTDFYPTAFPNISAEHLAEIMGDLLKDMILNPQKYSFKQE